MCNRVLCAIKFSRLRDIDSFALNYHLFCEEWDTCLIFHVSEDQVIFISGREEWEKDGEIESCGQEVNITLRVDRTRHVSESVIRPILGEKFSEWLEDSKALTLRRR